LGVEGWVRNLRDGRVEAAFEGDPDSVNAMANWCQHGPPHAEVVSVEIVDEEPVGESGFRIR
jgi:acylphosphatase